jgi:signal transduction histidine kinase
MHDLSLHLLELLENSIRAEATHVAVGFCADRTTDRVRLTIDDDGTGLMIDPAEVLDPFYTTKKDKKTGLGLSLLKADAEAAGGYLTISRSPTLSGVRVEAEMVLSHIDRTPVGAVGKSIMVMEMTNPGIDFTITLTGDQFDPPVIDGKLRDVRQRLDQITGWLDQQEVGEPQYAATRPAPRETLPKTED